MPAAASRRHRVGLAEARISGLFIHSVPARQQFHDRRRRFLNGTARNVDDRPLAFDEHPPRLAHLLSHGFYVRVLASLIVMENVQAVAAQLNQPFRIVGQPDDQRVRRVEQFRWERYSGNKGHIGCFDAAIGKVEASRRFRCARNTDKADIGIIDTPARLSVVMIEGESHCVDPREVFAVKQMLFAGQPSALSPEIGSERADNWIEDRDSRYLNTPAALLQEPAKRVADQCEQDDAPVGLDPCYYPFDLAARAHHAPHVLDGLCLVELDQASPSNRMNSFPGRVRDEVKVKSCHGREPGAALVIPCVM